MTKTVFVKILSKIGKRLNPYMTTSENITVKFNNGDYWKFTQTTKEGLLAVRKNITKNIDKEDFKNIVSIEFS